MLSLVKSTCCSCGGVSSTLITKHVVESGISRLVAGRTSLIRKQKRDILGSEFCVCACVCVCVVKGVSVCVCTVCG